MRRGEESRHQKDELKRGAPRWRNRIGSTGSVGNAHLMRPHRRTLKGYDVSTLGTSGDCAAMAGRLGGARRCVQSAASSPAGPVGGRCPGFVDPELAPYSAVGLTWRVALSFDAAFREASLMGRIGTAVAPLRGGDCDRQRPYPSHHHRGGGAHCPWRDEL